MDVANETGTRGTQTLATKIRPNSEIWSGVVNAGDHCVAGEARLARVF